MNYYKIKYFRFSSVRKRALAQIKALRKALDKKVPQRKLGENLLFGSWNIREFDGNSKKFGPRKEDSFLYIAEIISRFDVIALQEINEELHPLRQVMSFLGTDYKYIVTDVSAWKNGGNKERLGFIYDTRTVEFKGVAGELVLPHDLLIRNNNGEIERQFARSPFMCSFQSGWFKFMVTTVHIYYGSASESSNKFKRKIDEIDRVASEIAKKAENHKKQYQKRKAGWKNPFNYFIVGDFNIEDEQNQTYDALTKHGFKTVKNKKGTNRKRNKFYDQISYYQTSNIDFILNESEKETGRENNNVDRIFDFFKYLMTKDNFKFYKDDIKSYVSKNKVSFNKELKRIQESLEKDKTSLDSASTSSKKKTLQKRIEKKNKQIKILKDTIALKNNGLENFYTSSEWKTFQISDHLPLWTEIQIDKSDEYLDGL